VVVETLPTEALDDRRFKVLLRECYPDLLRLAFLILHDSSDAEDATQFAMEKAWRSRAQLLHQGSATSWLRRIVVREALRARSSPWRRLRSSVHLIDAEGLANPDVANRDEMLDLIRAFERLPANQSAAVVLHHYLAYPIWEIAEMLGVPIETVRSRLRLAMRRLREELQDA
jgi:RNA polymerase sigma-70 factor (ECF subfamily)